MMRELGADFPDSKYGGVLGLSPFFPKLLFPENISCLLGGSKIKLEMIEMRFRELFWGFIQLKSDSSESISR